jgi:hypothetical protein
VQLQLEQRGSTSVQYKESFGQDARFDIRLVPAENGVAVLFAKVETKK